MKSLVRPELPTASACSSQATSAAVDNSAPVQTRPFSLIYRGLAVQTNRATSLPKCFRYGPNHELRRAELAVIVIVLF